jgi:putative hydrolase of the HAD superfamily
LIMVLLFDAANTLIYKPLLFEKFGEALNKYGYAVDLHLLARVHKTIAEVYCFPDRTDKTFYSRFNSDLLYSLGIMPTTPLLEEIYSRCSYLKWERYADTDYLNSISFPKAIISNFHGNLNSIIKDLLPAHEMEILVSESEMLRKPDIAFYERAIDRLNVKAEEIFYIGDSLKLDVEPALKVGMNAWLIDRNNFYPYFEQKITTLYQLDEIINTVK